MAEVVVALDVPGPQEGIALAEILRGTVPWVKIGLELFTTGGPAVVATCKSMGFKVFLDLKMYDIPHTVASAVRAASRMGADMLTLHTQGGAEMCRAAREARDAGTGSKPLLFGVTVLTSMSAGDLPLCGDDVRDIALRLARDAQSWGLDGVVSSGHEVRTIKEHCPRLLCLTPGIRPSGSASGDQKRIMTPAAAVAAGSDFLVIGRPVTRHANPAQAALDIIKEIH